MSMEARRKKLNLQISPVTFDNPPCKGKGNLFFSYSMMELYEAYRICMSCPYLEECRENSKHERCGMWGGELKEYKSSEVYKSWRVFLKNIMRINREYEKSNGRPLL